jgi:hypothetical protein
MLDRILTVAAEQLQQLDPSVRILLAHPQYKSHQLLIQQFLNHFDGIYLKIDSEVTRPGDLESQIANTFDLYGIPPTDRDNFAIVFDNADALAPEILKAYFESRLQKPQSAPLLYCSRSYAHFVERFPGLEAVTQLWPVSQEQMLPDYLARDRNRRLVEVHALGSGRTVIDGEEIEDWAGSLPRHLFFYLIDRGLRTRNQIFDAIWPGVALREATNMFHVTKRKINEVLGFELATFSGGYYRLADHIDLLYDVSAYMESFQASAVADSPAGLILLEQCLALYRGDFLAGIDSRWIRQRRHEMRLLHSEALSAAARLSDQNQDPELAIGRYAQAYAFNPAREEFARNLIRVYTASGRKADSNAVREALKAQAVSGSAIRD